MIVDAEIKNIFFWNAAFFEKFFYAVSVAPAAANQPTKIFSLLCNLPNHCKRINRNLLRLIYRQNFSVSAVRQNCNDIYRFKIHITQSRIQQIRIGKNENNIIFSIKFFLSVNKKESEKKFSDS